MNLFRLQKVVMALWVWPLLLPYRLLVISLIKEQNLISLHSMENTLDKNRGIMKMFIFQSCITFLVPAITPISFNHVLRHRAITSLWIRRDCCSTKNHVMSNSKRQAEKHSNPSIFSHTSNVALHVAMLVSPPLWSRRKHLNKYWLDYSCLPPDEPKNLVFSFILHFGVWWNTCKTHDVTLSVSFTLCIMLTSKWWWTC